MLASYYLVNYFIQKERGIEEMHKISDEFSIVSLYSSIISLINNSQKEKLKRYEQISGNFDIFRGYSDNETPDPFLINFPTVSAVPEPEEWILIFLSVLFLLYVYRYNILKCIKRMSK